VPARTHSLRAELTRHGDTLIVTVTAENLDRVDAFVDDRPARSTDVVSRRVTFELDGWATAGQRLALAGYEKGVLAAARSFRLTAPGS